MPLTVRAEGGSDLASLSLRPSLGSGLAGGSGGVGPSGPATGRMEAGSATASAGADCSVTGMAAAESTDRSAAVAASGFAAAPGLAGCLRRGLCLTGDQGGVAPDGLAACFPAAVADRLRASSRLGSS